MEGISNVIQNGFRHTFGNSGGEKQVLGYPLSFPHSLSEPLVGAEILKITISWIYICQDRKKNRTKMLASVVFLCLRTPISLLSLLLSSMGWDSQGSIPWCTELIALISYPRLKVWFDIIRALGMLHVCANGMSNRRTYTGFDIPF